MKIALSIDDDLFEIYQTEARERSPREPGITVGDILRERLKKAVGLDPRERGVVLTGGRLLQRLEECLGGGQIQGTEDLTKKVERLASIRFGSHKFILSPGQYQELMHRATKIGPNKTIEDLIDEIWRRVSQDFFKYVP